MLSLDVMDGTTWLGNRYMSVAMVLVLSCAKHSLAYSRPSASCDILLSTPVVNDSQASEYSVYAIAYHLEVNGSSVFLTGAANMPEERISGKGTIRGRIATGNLQLTVSDGGLPFILRRSASASNNDMNEGQTIQAVWSLTLTIGSPSKQCTYHYKVSRDGPFLGVTVDGSLAAAHSSTSQYVTTSDLQAAAFGAAVLVLILVQFAMYAASQHYSKKKTTSAKAI